MIGQEIHDLGTLFAQLGLERDDEAIERFVAAHRLPPQVELAEADFWNESQASFLREAIQRDSAWAIVVDELDVRLREG